MTDPYIQNTIQNRTDQPKHHWSNPSKSTDCFLVFSITTSEEKHTVFSYLQGYSKHKSWYLWNQWRYYRVPYHFKNQRSIPMSGKYLSACQLLPFWIIAHTNWEYLWNSIRESRIWPMRYNSWTKNSGIWLSTILEPSWHIRTGNMFKNLWQFFLT